LVQESHGTVGSCKQKARNTKRRKKTKNLVKATWKQTKEWKNLSQSLRKEREKKNTKLSKEWANLSKK
jgi:hypothetical protein